MDDSIPPPASPTSTPTPEPPPASSPAPEIEPRVAAGLCAIFPLLGGIIFLVIEKKNAFVRFWAMQSVIFGCAMLLVSIFLEFATFLFRQIPYLGKLLAWLLGIVALAYGVCVILLWVIMIAKAFSRAEWEVPFLGKLARRQLSGQKLV
jgi:uncharacterized membrane protein